MLHREIELNICSISLFISLKSNRIKNANIVLSLQLSNAFSRSKDFLFLSSPNPAPQPNGYQGFRNIRGNRYVCSLFKNIQADFANMKSLLEANKMS